MVFHVRVDRATQGPEGHETEADRLRVNSEDLLWVYVEAELPLGSVQGEYFAMRGDQPIPDTRVVLATPTKVNGQYRFLVVHYVLAKNSKYLFHFANSLASPMFEDSWEVQTI